MQLAGMTALVTGGGSGVGRATVQALSAAGAAVATCGRRLETLSETLALLPEGARSHAVQADVSQPDQVDALVAEVEAELGPIGLLVNNAGNFHYKPFLEHTLADWQISLDVNMTATFLTCQRVLPGMLERGTGRVINIASAYGVYPAAKVVANSSSKAGLIGLTKALAAEFKTSGIAINAICPGAITTRPRPAEGAASGADLFAEDVADLVVYLASPGATQICGAAVELLGKTDPVLKVRGW